MRSVDCNSIPIELTGPVLRILLAVGSAPLRLMLGGRLRAHGYHVVEAGDGCHALLLALENSWDVIIAAWQLPRVTGADFLAALRNESDGERQPVKILVHNGQLTDHIRSEALYLRVHALIRGGDCAQRFMEVLEPLEDAVTYERALDYASALPDYLQPEIHGLGTMGDWLSDCTMEEVRERWRGQYMQYRAVLDGAVTAADTREICLALHDLAGHLQLINCSGLRELLLAMLSDCQVEPERKPLRYWQWFLQAEQEFWHLFHFLPME